MAEFTPITLNTQEEVNHFMADRLERAKRTGAEEEAKKFAGFDDFKAKAEKYDSDVEALNKTIAGLRGEKEKGEARISELETKVREYETSSVKMRIAREAGLPAELADRISGSDEEAMRADAESLGKLFKSQNVAPMYKPSGEGGADGKDAALRGLLQKVRES